MSPASVIWWLIFGVLIALRLHAHRSARHQEARIRELETIGRGLADSSERAINTLQAELTAAQAEITRLNQQVRG